MDARSCAAAIVCAIAFFHTAAAGASCPNYDRAMELARAGDLQMAQVLLERCAASYPSDKTYPIELAGIAYLRKDMPTARWYLREALRVDSKDAYANEFLGTLYFLDGRDDAALACWNRAGLPRIGAVDTTHSGIRSDLLDGLLRFAPGGVLKLDDYLTTRARLDPFGMSGNLSLTARPTEDYTVEIAASNDNRWMALARALRGVTTAALTPEWTNLGGRGIHTGGLYRWDAQKRRVQAFVSWPAASSPKHWFTLRADARKETWNIGAPDDFRMNRVALEASLDSIESGRWRWQSGLVVANRWFAAAPGFIGGTTLKYRGKIQRLFLYQPQRGLQGVASGQFEVGKWFTHDSSTYARLRTDLVVEWTPHLEDGRYRMCWRATAGEVFGTAPFDELYSVGMGVDSDLWLRGHRGTDDGRNGHALIGRQYALMNWEVERRLLTRSFITIGAGPFVDIARVHDFRGDSDRRLWQVDGGLQVTFRLFNIVQVTALYGRDTRGHQGVFDVNQGLPVDFFNQP